MQHSSFPSFPYDVSEASSHASAEELKDIRIAKLE